MKLLSTFFFISAAIQLDAFPFTSKEVPLNANSETKLQKESPVNQFDTTIPFTTRLVHLCGNRRQTSGLYNIQATREEDEKGNIVIRTCLTGMLDEMQDQSQTLDLEKKSIRIAILLAIAHSKNKEDTFFKLDNHTKCQFYVNIIKIVKAECVTVITPELFSKLMKELD